MTEDETVTTKIRFDDPETVRRTLTEAKWGPVTRGNVVEGHVCPMCFSFVPVSEVQPVRSWHINYHVAIAECLRHM